MIYRTFSLEFKLPPNVVNAKWQTLKDKCENDLNHIFIQSWIKDEHVSYRHKDNHAMWNNNNHIIVLYKDTFTKPPFNPNSWIGEDYPLFWNHDILKPMITSFIHYANDYIGEDIVIGDYEFVNNGTIKEDVIGHATISNKEDYYYNVTYR